MPLLLKFDTSSPTKQSAVIPDATRKSAGLMTAAMVRKLDGIVPGGGETLAQAYDNGSSSADQTLTYDVLKGGALRISASGLADTLPTTDVLVLVNPTAATGGVPVQYSPAQLFEGHLFTGGLNRQMRIRAQMRPDLSTGRPVLALDSEDNGVASRNILTIQDRVMGLPASAFSWSIERADSTVAGQTAGAINITGGDGGLDGGAGGGNGSQVRIDSGAGGAAGVGGPGGRGGEITLIASKGGNGSATQVAGDGGAVFIRAGNSGAPGAGGDGAPGTITLQTGGTDGAAPFGVVSITHGLVEMGLVSEGVARIKAVNATSTGDSGVPLFLLTGSGANGNGGTPAGNGGALFLEALSAGSNAGGGAGIAGGVLLASGNGSPATVAGAAPSVGGLINITAGAGGTANDQAGARGGLINITAGLGGNSGTTGAGAAAKGGTVTIRGGNAGVNGGGGDASGGEVIIDGGTRSGAGGVIGQVWISTVSNGITLIGSATGKVGFLGAPAIGPQACQAITNAVTAGGVNGTIANFTDLNTYSVDAPTIRDDIYQLARALGQVSSLLVQFGLGV